MINLFTAENFLLKMPYVVCFGFTIVCIVKMLILKENGWKDSKMLDENNEFFISFFLTILILLFGSNILNTIWYTSASIFFENFFYLLIWNISLLQTIWLLLIYHKNENYFTSFGHFISSFSLFYSIYAVKIAYSIFSAIFLKYKVSAFIMLLLLCFYKCFILFYLAYITSILSDKDNDYIKTYFFKNIKILSIGLMVASVSLSFLDSFTQINQIGVITLFTVLLFLIFICILTVSLYFSKNLFKNYIKNNFLFINLLMLNIIAIFLFFI